MTTSLSFGPTQAKWMVAAATGTARHLISTVTAPGSGRGSGRGPPGAPTPQLRVERSDGRRREDRLHALVAECPERGSGGHQVRWELVPGTVTGHEHDLPPGEGSPGQRPARYPERCRCAVDDGRRVEQRGEARPTDHTDRSEGTHATPWNPTPRSRPPWNPRCRNDSGPSAARPIRARRPRRWLTVMRCELSQCDALTVPAAVTAVCREAAPMMPTAC